MNLKLDENFDVRLFPLLAAEGFDSDTVLAEGLSSSPDETIYDTCKSVGRTLVTLDLDFSNPFHFSACGHRMHRCGTAALSDLAGDPGDVVECPSATEDQFRQRQTVDCGARPDGGAVGEMW